MTVVLKRRPLIQHLIGRKLKSSAITNRDRQQGEHIFEIMFADDTNLFTTLCRLRELEHLLEQVLGH